MTNHSDSEGFRPNMPTESTEGRKELFGEKFLSLRRETINSAGVLAENIEKMLEHMSKQGSKTHEWLLYAQAVSGKLEELKDALNARFPGLDELEKQTNNS